jgi:hypothetical protein
MLKDARVLEAALAGDVQLLRRDQLVMDPSLPDQPCTFLLQVINARAKPFPVVRARVVAVEGG